MNGERRPPAGFLLVNSNGYPDFIMTMLVVVIVAILLLLLAWLGFNFVALRITADVGVKAGNSLVEILRNFNDNTQVIVISLASSVFSLAGAYFLRRSAKDKQHVELKKIESESARVQSQTEQIPQGSFAPMGAVTLTHPGYDDEDEDI